MNDDLRHGGRPVRLLQVGIGDWGLSWGSQIIPQVPGIEIVGYVSRDEGRIARAMSELNMRRALFFDTLGDALTAVDADGVLVLTTTNSHKALVAEALEAGKHVLVEKPFVADLEDGGPLIELAARNKLHLIVNQNFRYFPAAMRAADLVRSLELGALGELSIDFRQKLSFPSAERARWHHEMVQPLILDMGIHHFDLMRMVVGAEPVSVVAAVPQMGWSPYRDPASASALIRFENGVLANWRASWISGGPATTFSGDWKMEFESARVDWACRGDRDLTLAGDRLSILHADQLQEELLDQPQLFGRSGVLNDFCAAVRGKQTSNYLPTASDNIKSLALADAVLRAVESGERVNL